MAKYKSKINREEDSSQHKWEKKNLITIVDSKGNYDILKCKKCGIEGISKTIGIIELETNSLNKINKFNKCPKYVESLDDEPWDVGNSVIITNISFQGIEAKFLTEGSEHKIVTPPKEYINKYPNSHFTVWVMGLSEPIRLLSREFKFKN